MAFGSNLIQILNVENRFLQSLVILVAFFALSQLFVLICTKFLMKFTKKTKNEVDDHILESTHKKISFLLILVGIKLALAPLGLEPTLYELLQDIVSSVIIIVLTLVAIAITNIILRSWGHAFASKTSSKVDDQILMLTRRFSKTIYFIIAFLFILQSWNIEIGALLASLGIAGLAIAFALQNTLGNIFGGLSLILDKTIKVGDRIELDTGESGVVKDVGLRSTKIRTWSNKIIVIPNGVLADAKITNYIRSEKKTRVVVSFSVAYGTNLEKVRKVVIPELKKVKEALKSPVPDIYFSEMAEFSLNFDAKFWVKSVDDVHIARQEANTRIYNALNKAKIEIPFPTRTIYMKK